MRGTLLYIGTAMILLAACSAKHTPEKSNTAAAKPAAAKSTASGTAAPKKTTVISVPKVIAVNDKAAKKNFDGRLYYDLNGRRYWKNYNNGKYYLFSQSMYTDSAFIPH